MQMDEDEVTPRAWIWNWTLGVEWSGDSVYGGREDVDEDDE
jgi:hypothetical protein